MGEPLDRSLPPKPPYVGWGALYGAPLEEALWSHRESIKSPDVSRHRHRHCRRTILPATPASNGQSLGIYRLVVYCLQVNSRRLSVLYRLLGYLEKEQLFCSNQGIGQFRIQVLYELGKFAASLYPSHETILVIM